jgi:hypothetical protein
MSYVTENMREAMQKHTLEIEADTPTLRAWYLRKPGRGRMDSTLIIETREGLVIMGDRSPGDNGVISTLGYGAEWFWSKLSEEYLCGKFLRRVFQFEIAFASAKSSLLELRRSNDITKESAREAWTDLHDLGDDAALYEFYDIMRHAGASDWGIDGEGMGYDESDAGWLCAIQQRFRELMLAKSVGTAAA